MRPRRAVAALVLCALAAPATAHAQVPSFPPPLHADGRDRSAGALDVRAIAFGQRDLKMVLHVRTHGAWTPRGLTGGRSLCLLLVSRGGRLCVVAGRNGRGFLRHQPEDGRDRVIAAAVTRPDARSLRARFAPRELELPYGRIDWALEARSRGATDRVPDTGTRRASVSVLAQPFCFAAAARDRRRPCRNPSLDRVVYPRPSFAFVWPNAACRGIPGGTPEFDPCEFGVSTADRTGTVALVGDSHAVHWRGALEVVAQARRWRGVSITRAGCPFSVRVPNSPSLGPEGCRRQHRETIAWLRSHPEVETLFVSSWAQANAGPQGGRGGYGGFAAAFGAMFDQVPASVKRIYVLRDIPRTRPRGLGCVQSRRRKRLPVAGRCSIPRGRALIPDPAAGAAAARPRVHVIDLTEHFCSARRCFPVVGGTYIYKDYNHMNAVFSTSLGPFVLRALRD